MPRPPSAAARRGRRPVAASSARPAVEVRIPASPEFVRVARLAVTGVAGGMDFSHNDIDDMKLAVAEACNNAIEHAGVCTDVGDAELAMISVLLTPYPDRLEISVTNEGVLGGASIEERAEQRRAAGEPAIDELPERGLGLLLIHAMMDDVEHVETTPGCTTVRMVKRLPLQARRQSAQVAHR